MTKELPGAGHFICADRCKFTMHTHIDGRYCVSTVGDFYYTEGGPRQDVGYQRAFETMVFDMKRKAKRWQQIDCDGYPDASRAKSGHRKAVKRWGRKARA